MTDDARVGIGGPGQRTTERVGGRDAEIEQPRELTWDRMQRRAAEALFVVLGVPLLVGPWVLAVYVPLYLERAAYSVADWFGIEVDVNRTSMACLGVLVLIALIVVPDALMGWWPFGWQRSTASLRGLLWPAAWPGVVPLVLLLRALPIVVSLAAWPEVWYLDQRQRQGTIAPTLDSVAYAQVEPGNVAIPGVYNVHSVRTKAEPDPVDHTGDFVITGGAAQSVSYTLPGPEGNPAVAVGGNGNGHHEAIQRIPRMLFTRQHEAPETGYIRLSSLAVGLMDGSPWSEPEWTGSGGPFTPTEWRELTRWMKNAGYVYKTGSKRNDPHDLTAAGRCVMRRIAEVAQVAV